MPLIESSSYPGPPWYQINGHVQTIVPSVFRKVDPPPYRRERLTLSDGDFLDIDWLEQGASNMVLLGHGLEGSSDRTYIRGMAHYFFQRGWDVVAWNCRSCSGEMNRKLRLYHHGEIGDIHEVIQHVLSQRAYPFMGLVGFSLGGNIILKYLGVNGRENIPNSVKVAVAFSAPCDLEAGVEKLEQPSNRFYRKRFLDRLKIKIEAKAKQFPEVVDATNLEKIDHWRDFDEFFSAPINGYQSATEFYQDASAKNFVKGINIPTLLVNASNDPLLTPSCNPVEIAQNNEFLFLERPRKGGHTGFSVAGNAHTWAELRAFEFISGYLKNS